MRLAIVAQGRCLAYCGQGNYERFRVALHDLSFHNSVTIVGNYAATDGQAITLDLLRAALQRVVDRHPALTATVREADTETPYFETLPEIDVDQVVKLEVVPKGSDCMNWTEGLLSRENSNGFTGGRLPLWRTTVLDHQECTHSHYQSVVFTYHHVIADGMSGLAAHASILEALNTVSDGVGLQETCKRIIKITPKALLPSMDTIFGWSTAQGASLARWILSWTPFARSRSWSQSRPKLWAGCPHNFQKPIITMHKALVLSSERTKRLVKRCDFESTTINPFFQALVGAVLLETFPAAGALRCACAMEIRRFIPVQFHISNYDMGLWISSWHENYIKADLKATPGRVDSKPGAEMPWEQARRSRHRIEQELAKGASDLETEYVKGSVQGFMSSLPKMEGQPRENSYSIINLGAFKPPPSASATWRLSGLQFSQSAHANGSALQLGIVTLYGGELCMTVNWQKGIVDEADVDRIRSTLQHRLEAITDEEIPGDKVGT